MDLTPNKTTIKDLWHILVLVALVGLFLGVLTWTNILPSDAIPGWRDIYDPVYLAISGKQEMLIVHGNDGLGNETELARLIRDPRYVGKTVQTRHVSLLSAGNLTEYDVVIVTHAKTLSTKQLQYFIDYANAGGKLIWTGDAGTKLSAGDRELSSADLDENGSSGETFGPWARVGDGIAVRMDELLGLNYYGNFCSVTTCDQEGAVNQGQLVSSSPNHPLIFGLREDAVLYGDFAIVSELGGIGNKRVLSLDHGSNVILDNDPSTDPLPGVPSEGNENLGQVFPIIVTSGLGEKVIYYAQPLESFKSKGKNEQTGVEEFRSAVLFLERMYKTLRR